LVVVRRSAMCNISCTQLMYERRKLLGLRLTGQHVLRSCVQYSRFTPTL
jgi:hypothetical protein